MKNIKKLKVRLYGTPKEGTFRVYGGNKEAEMEDVKIDEKISAEDVRKDAVDGKTEKYATIVSVLRCFLHLGMLFWAIFFVILDAAGVDMLIPCCIGSLYVIVTSIMLAIYKDKYEKTEK